MLFFRLGVEQRLREIGTLRALGWKVGRVRRVLLAEGAVLAGIGSLAIPGVGPFIAAGPIMAALSGAAIGGTTGGVLGGLIGLGIPEIEAKRYEDKLKKGSYLIAVHADGDREDVAKDIFEKAGAEDITSSSMASTPDR